MDEHHVSVAIVTIVALGVGAQWLAWRARLPAIVLLASAGLLAGPVFGIIDPTAEFGAKLQPLISLCVAIILFEGGLSLDFRDLKVAATGVRRLVYAGAPLAWGLAACAAHFIGGLDWPVALVFGAIMVVTGPTVIIPMLRQAHLNKRTASYMKWEGIVNDPIGALLAVFTFQFLIYVGEGSGVGAIIAGLGWALASSALLGGLGGWLTGHAFRRGMVPEYLKSPVMLGLVLVVYVASNSLQHEAGLLAVTFMGIVVGNMHLPGIHDLKRFKEYITVLLVSVVFILLTAALKTEVLLSITWRGAALVAAILFLVRPVAITLATLGAKMDIRDRALLGWIAPRGIVAAATAGVMGPGLAAAGYAGADQLLPLVFAVIFATVVLHGLSIGSLVRYLGLTSKERDSILLVGASPWSIELAAKLKDMGQSVLVADDSWHNLRPARLAGVRVFYGEILSDFAEESMEIGHISSVLAATSNDAYNALVCTSMAPEIGRSRVFQLPMGGSQEDDPRRMARPLRGRLAFHPEAVFEKLWRLHVRGWKFYRTKISETYSYSDFLGDCPADTLEVLLVSSDGAALFRSPQEPTEPSPGDTILYYGPARATGRAEKTEKPDQADSSEPGAKQARPS